MPRETILRELADLSVWINDLLIPAKALEARLVRHAFNLVVHNDDPTFKVSLVGSATAVRVRDRYFLLCTSHQLEGVDPERVAMMLDDGSILVTSGRFTSFATRSADDTHDIAAFDFTEPVLAYPSLARRFFDLQGPPPPVNPEDIVGLLLAGFPSRKQNYDLEQNNHLGLAKLVLSCVPDGRPSDAALLRARVVSPIDFDPDGMSGGSAFVIVASQDRFRGYFSGIILRGGREYFHILEPGLVLQFLRAVLELN